MATQVQFRRGTTAEHSSFTGASGEVTVDTTLTTLKVHDGATAGGVRLAKFADIAASTITFSDESSNTLTVTPGSSDIKFKGSGGLTPAVTGDTLTYSLASIISVNEINSSDSTGVQINDTLNVNEIASTDSTAIQINDGVNISGTLSVDTIDTNTISSGDSTSVLFSDGITLSGAIKSDASGQINIDDALDVEGAITTASTVTATGNITTSGSFVIGSASMNETDLEKLDGITNGTAAANKALVADANIDIGTLRNVTATGSFIIGSADMNETDLEKLDGITNGTVAANKAVVVDGNLDAGSFRNITATGTVTTAILDVNSIASTDSTAVRINEGLDVIGTLQVNDISGIDSSAIQVNEAINLNGAVQVNSTVTSTGNITTLGSFVIGSASMDETDLEKLDGITNGTAVANKAVVLDGSKDIGTLGAVTATTFVIGSADIDETDLEKIDGITNGTAAANKALVADSNIDIGTLRNVTATGTITGDIIDTNSIQSTDSAFVNINDGLNVDGNIQTTSGTGTFGGVVTAAGFTIGSAAIVEAELEMIDGITAGTAAASKAVVLDGSKDIGTIRNITSNGTIQFGSLSDGTITATAFVDEDDMSSNSATLIPTQQSVKAYVDGEVASSASVKFSDLASNTGTISFASEEIVFAGGAGITTSVTAGGNTVTHNLDTTVNLDVIASSDSSFVTINDGLNVDGNIQTTSGTGTFGGVVTAGGFTIGSAAIVEAELEMIDGITAGTVAASKAVVVDSDKDITGGRNITISGELDAATGDFSGDVDVDGTLEADAITVGGTALATVIAGTTVTLASTVTCTANNTADENVFITFVDGATGAQGIETDTNLTYNPNTNVIASTASAAQYSDLAEKYVADAQYEPGTVVIFGGDNEVTTTEVSHDPRVAGVVSTAPAYLMNSSLEATHVIELALTGRVPCKVKGVVAKGDIIVASNVAGVGMKLNSASYQVGCIIGKALESKDTPDEGVIEVVVGRL